MTLVEIESAAKQLSPADRQKLLLVVAESLRAAGYPLPSPRQFSVEEMEAWMDEDEADMRQLRGENGSVSG